MTSEMEERGLQHIGRPGLRATYRLQLHRGFTLREALALVPYLEALGVSHVYVSPLLTARAGSTHGYDVCDPTRLNPELGTEADLEALVRALRERTMGLVLDIVPNHMGIGGEENPWWWTLLQQGRASQFADYFDVDWDVPDPKLRGKVLVPVLGDDYERVLERGELKLQPSPRGVVVTYFEHRFPLNPESLTDLEGISAPLLAELNAKPAALVELLERQHYRLAHWRQGDAALNYRRFFNITSLAGIRVERPDVFEATHQRILEWYRSGKLDGLRVDHPDGLYDPEAYLKTLRAAAPESWLVVEKILMRTEELPTRWPVEGTTGYEFLNRLGGLFVDSTNEKPFSDFYAEFTGESTDYAAVVREKKRLVLRQMFRAELSRLQALLVAVADGEAALRPFDAKQWQAALVELVAAFPVYRTYIQAAAGQVSEADTRYVEEAVAAARKEAPTLSALLDFLREVLLLCKRTPRAAEWVMRFQQLTGPAMAKGVEDTAFYCYNRFVALNEVGGDPGCFGRSAPEFHQTCRQAQQLRPLSLLATSTHDTKRSEDMRARLALLSEIPDQWRTAVRHWSRLLEKYRQQNFPDRNAEYLFYQTVVGAWPLPVERAQAFMLKAAREAKQHTSWADTNSVYEQALERFVGAALADPAFTGELERFVAPLIEPGQVNSLAQTLLKLTAPGVPDIYQGTELWDLSLVDPDNRRPVDFALRQKLLANVNLSAEEVWSQRQTGLPKLWLIWRTLSLRAQRPHLFAPEGAYQPLEALGTKAPHLVALARGDEVVTVVPRLVLGLNGKWGDTVLSLPPGIWQNELTGEIVRSGKIAAGALCERFPVALLSRLND